MIAKKSINDISAFRLSKCFLLLHDVWFQLHRSISCIKAIYLIRFGYQSVLLSFSDLIIHEVMKYYLRLSDNKAS